MSPKKSAEKKVLMITGTWPAMPCGVGDYTHRLCEHLSPLPVRLRVLTSQSVLINTLPRAVKIEVRPLVKQWNGSILELVKQQVREFLPEVVHIQWPTAVYGRSLAINWLPVILKKSFPQLPLVTTLHELRYFKPWTRLRTWPAILKSDRLILVDPRDWDQVRKYPASCLIPIGANLPPVSKFNRSKQRQQLGFQTNDFVVAFFGFANSPKGLEYLLSALANLHSRYPKIKLLLLSQLSEQDAYQRKCLRQLAQPGLREILVQPEYSEPPRAAEILASSDCAVLPFPDGISWKRGSALACLAQGLPLISTQPGQAPFADRENIYLVPPRDEHRLGQAIEELYRNPALRKRLAQGTKSLMRCFDWKNIARQHFKLYQSLGKLIKLQG